MAGSEKTETAKTEGTGLREGININKSLSCLGQCIGGLAKIAASKDREESKKTPEQKAAEEEERKASAAAAEKKKKKDAQRQAKKQKSKFGVKTGAAVKRIEKDENFVPFRDSVLTWILRDSLCGNSKTVMRVEHSNQFTMTILAPIALLGRECYAYYFFLSHDNIHCS